MDSNSKIFDFPIHQLENFPLDKAFNTKYNGEWKSISTQEFINQYNALSKALLDLGVKPNDKIAISSSNNRTEWSILDIAILQVGAQSVPIYPTISENDFEYIFNHSESIYCFVSDAELLAKIKNVKDKTALKDIYTFDMIDGKKNINDLIEKGKTLDLEDDVEKIKQSIQPDDLATIIYTSGTTGKPKGVMLSHRNLVSNPVHCGPRVPVKPGNSIALSFLPVCHVFERMILYLYMHNGVEIHFAESLETIADNIKEVKPHIITGVPRLYEKFFDKIFDKGKELSGIKQKLFYWAVELGLQYEPNGANGWWYEFKLKIARKLIFSKWKAGLGGNLSIMVSGSAALQPRLARVFSAAEMYIVEGYGLTETSPVIAVNNIVTGEFKMGAVGKPIDYVEVKIAEDGEILVKGPNIMLGYFKDEEKTASVMTGDYFHTGDIGELDKDGYLSITDRKKEIFKTSGGKYIVPTLIENQLKQSKFIEQVMVIGEGEKMPAAFIQVNFEFVKDWVEIKNISGCDSPEAIICNPEVIERIQQEVNTCNEKFGNWERIKRFELTPEEWSIDAGHLTPTMKVKRKVVKKIYKNLYDKIYNR